eukprot:scpid74068/ scgid10300/ 
MTSSVYQYEFLCSCSRRLVSYAILLVAICSQMADSSMAVSVGKHDGEFLEIHSGETLHNLQLGHGKSLALRLVGLDKQRSYTIRISYPATTPTEFVVDVFAGLQLHPTVVRPQRALMNVEQMRFSPDSLPRNGEGNGIYARVTAWRTGVARDPELLAQPVAFNLVLEKLYMGQPLHVWAFVAFALCGILLITLSVPTVHVMIRYAVDTFHPLPVVLKLRTQ